MYNCNNHSYNRPDTVRLTKDDVTKNVDDSMDTMDMYQLFANQENNSNVEAKSSESSKSPSPDTRYLFTIHSLSDVIMLRQIMLSSFFCAVNSRSTSRQRRKLPMWMHL